MSARKAAEAALQASEQRFRGLADNIDQLAWIADHQWEITWYNQRWHDFTGTTLDEVRGWGWQAVHHPDHVDRVVTSVRRSHASGEPWEDTFPLRRHDGEYRWFLSRAQPVRDANGDVTSWFGTNTDVTDQLAREAQVRLLMREVNHRSKNMLAVVHAVARQTLAISPEDFVARFDQRILALAAAHDLLVDSDWRGVDLGALIRSQLAHFGDMIGARIVLSGPPVRLTSAAGQMIGMAMHELATNAGKYGALRDTQGRVGIGWQASADGLAIEWIERDGPPVEAPARAGFGSRVIG
ncbi:histidine kinase, partial [alpha proteobacterium AAP81b]